MLAGQPVTRWHVAAAVLVGSLMSGCAFGPMPSATGRDGIVMGSIGAKGLDGAGLGEIHSGTCKGLRVERQDRLRRIEALQAAMAAELASPPATLAQALQRAGETPEAGTLAYREIAGEKVHLDALIAAATKLGCSLESPAKAL